MNETFGRRLVRFPIAADGALGARETVAVFGKGTFPDGLAFDAAGGVWVTSIVSNRVIRVGSNGAQQLVLEDADEAHVDWCEQAFAAGEMGRAHMDACGGRFLKNISSLAFGGADLRTAYLGCLKGDSVAAFRSPMAGHPPVHWRWIGLSSVGAAFQPRRSRLKASPTKKTYWPITAMPGAGPFSR